MNSEQYYFPSLGKSIEIPLHSKDEQEMFSLDISSGKIFLQKHTLQTRARKKLILARLDLSGPPHRNPDGKDVPCPHIHVYRESYHDKWANPLPDCFSSTTDVKIILEQFMNFCHIVEKPIIALELFI